MGLFWKLILGGWGGKICFFGNEGIRKEEKEESFVMFFFFYFFFFVCVGWGGEE